ncbi:MAG: DUF2029 domain-containing protein [Phycisphaerales bacterium]|nr:DUF2029 domain-containing protein [Phycisphaerales bacterium]
MSELHFPPRAAPIPSAVGGLGPSIPVLADRAHPKGVRHRSLRAGGGFGAAITWCGLGVALIALVTGIHAAGSGRTADFGCFLYGARAAATGGDLQAPGGGYIYPPLLAVLLRPLTWLAPSTAALVWNSLMWGLLAGASVGASRLALEQVGRVSSRWAEAGVVAGLAWLVLGDKLILELRDGNCDAVIVVCWLVALASVRRRPWLVGLAIGLAFNIKYTAAVLVVYMLARRWWREAGWAAVWGAVFAVFPALAMGWRATGTAWAGALGGLARLFGVASPGAAAEIHPVTWDLSVSITSALAKAAARLGWAPSAGEVLALVLALVVGVGTLVWLARRGVAPFWRRGWKLGVAPPGEGVCTAVEWWGMLAGLLVFSPQTPIRHLNMALPLVCLAGAMVYRLVPMRRGWLPTVALLVFAGTLWLPPGGEWSHAILQVWRDAAAPSLGLVLLLFSVVWGLAWLGRGGRPGGVSGSGGGVSEDGACGCWLSKTLPDCSPRCATAFVGAGTRSMGSATDARA